MTTNNQDVFEHDMSHGGSQLPNNAPDDESSAASCIDPNRNSSNTSLDATESSSSASPVIIYRFPTVGLLGISFRKEWAVFYRCQTFSLFYVPKLITVSW